MPLEIAIVLGQASRGGRLAAATAALADEIGKARENVSVAMVDLSASPVDWCDGRTTDAYGPATRRMVEAIQRASAVVFCSPVYRASFSGVLKNALDLLPIEALRDKPTGIVAMGAGDHHFLAVDGHLRGVLAWFGAIALPTSVYLTGRNFSPERVPSHEAREMLRALGGSLVDLAERVSGTTFGPAPLSARSR
jgi:FMN reductase